MILKAFAVFDVKADCYLPPFFMPTIGQATRAFSDGVNDPQTPFSKHPEDYRLCQIGTFDDSSGVLSSCSVEQLGGATEYIRKNGGS